MSAPFFRHANNKRDLQTGIIDPAFASREPATMVSPKPNNRLLGQSVLFELPEQIGDLVVRRGDRIVVIGPIASDERRVRIIRWQDGFVGIVPFRSEERRVGKGWRSRWSPYH